MLAALILQFRIISWEGERWKGEREKKKGREGREGDKVREGGEGREGAGKVHYTTEPKITFSMRAFL